MATKTEDLIDTVQLEVARVQTFVEGLQNQIERSKLTEILTRLAILEAAVTDLKKWREEFDRRGERLAVLEAQFAELKKQFEEKDRRWWHFWVGVALVGFAFIANLVIQIILLVSRKPA